MSKQGLENQKNYPLHKKVREFFWGGWFMQGLWNYERQMNTAFMWGISGTGGAGEEKRQIQRGAGIF